MFTATAAPKLTAPTRPRHGAVLPGLAAVGLLALLPSAARAQVGTFQALFAPQPVSTLTTTNPPTFSATFNGTYAGGPNNVIGGSATIGITGSGTAPAVTTLITPAGGTPFNETTANLTSSTVALNVLFNGVTSYSDTYTGSLHYVYDGVPNNPSAYGTSLALSGLLTDTTGQEYLFQINEQLIPSGSYRANGAFTPVPEASTTVSLGLLLALGLGGMVVAAKRKKAGLQP